jgi:ubiquinol-cytochrome c reductase cytochrome b subunit
MRWHEWVVDRFGLDFFKKYFLHRRVARAPWYYGDGATLLFLLGVLVVTGAFMTLTYSPTPDTAYQSVRYITEGLPLGWFVRALHYWSAGLMVVMVFFHLFRQILVGGYKFPREGTWLIGVLLFFAVMVMAFTGYVLRWDERGIHALRVSLHMFSRVPMIGHGLVEFVQGGREIGGLTLSRLYSVHVIWVPVLLILLSGYHLYLVVLHGITAPAEGRQPIPTVEVQRKIYKEEAEGEKSGEPFFPDTTAKSGLMGIVVFLVAVLLAVVVGPQRLYREGNLVEVSFPAEEWWFWWYSALIALTPNWFAPWLVLLFPAGLFLFLVLLPFIDRGPFRGMRRRPLAVGFVAVSVIGLFYLTDLRIRSPWTGWPAQVPPPVPLGVALTADAEAGRQLFARYGCNSCHAISGHGPEVGTDLARIRYRMSRAEIRNYILYPPIEVPMPSYAGHLVGEELERVVEFVHVAQSFPRKQN